MNKRTYRKKIKKQNHRKKQTYHKKQTHRKQRGGSDINAVLLGLLDERYVTLPSTRCINDKKLINIYLNSVTALDLFGIIGETDKYVNSNTINGLIQDIDNKSSDIFKQLGSMTKSPTALKMMSNFRVNCFKLTTESNNSKSNVYMKELHSYILDCEDYISIKDTDWFQIVLGLKQFDDEFENSILEEMRNRRIIIDTDKFYEGLKILRKDDKVRLVCKNRILECGNNPQSFMDSMFGSVSWDSYNDCFKCSDDKCIVYLDDNYKSFLKQKHNILTVDKIKILIYMELRLRKLSKHFSLSAIRITGKRTGKVKSLLSKIYNEDENTGNISNYNDKQNIMMRQMNNDPMNNNPMGIQTGGVEPDPLSDIEGPKAMPPAIPGEIKLPEGDLPDLPPGGDLPDLPPGGDLPGGDLPDLPPGGDLPGGDLPDLPPGGDLPGGDLPDLPPGGDLPDLPPGGDLPDLPPGGDLPGPPPTGDEPVDSLPPPEIRSSDIKEEESSTPIAPLEEEAPTFSKMFYVSFNGTINNDKLKESISKQVKENILDITQLTNKDRLKVYRVRVGPRTISVEIGIEEPKGDELTTQQIKENIVKSIVDKSFVSKMIVLELDTVKDVYFDDITKFDELKDMPSQYKRVLVEMEGIYPENEAERIGFEDKILNNIVEYLEEPDIDLNRIQLENITNITNKTDRIFVQFLIMNGLYEKKSPHEIITDFKNKYSENDGSNDFTTKYNISNVAFGEPSVILDNEGVDKMKTLSDETSEFKAVSTFENLDTDYKRLSYFGCDLAVNDINNNMITAYTPLSEECEGDINRIIRGY